MKRELGPGGRLVLEGSSSSALFDSPIYLPCAFSKLHPDLAGTQVKILISFDESLALKPSMEIKAVGFIPNSTVPTPSFVSILVTSLKDPSIRTFIFYDGITVKYTRFEEDCEPLRSPFWRQIGRAHV